MSNQVTTPKTASQGYVYVSYGKPKYLQHVLASVYSLRRYDKKRPVAIVCTREHLEILEKEGLSSLFAVRHEILPENASIVGFKHHLHKFMFFEKNIFLDSDIIWCKDPNSLWLTFEPYPYTVTGVQTSDNFFGAPKGLAVLGDILLGRRKRTLKKFGLTYLSRVQSGVIYAKDKVLTQQISELAQNMLHRMDETHFQSRLKEKNRTMESCEWSLAMALSKLNIPIYPWMQGQTSVQLDFIENYTTYNEDFTTVQCKYYSDTFVYNLRGLKIDWLQTLLTRLFSIFPGRGDFLLATPYCLHFGWLHEKQPFYDFSDRVWEELTEAMKK